MGLLLTWMSSDSKRRRAPREIKPSIEPMESRRLLSTSLVGHPMIAHRRALFAERVQQAHERVQAYNAEHSENLQTLTGGIDFTTNTVDTGKKLATSKDVLSVGVNFAKRGVAQDTTRVGWEYVKAVARADGKTLRGLGNTTLVKQVGQEFAALGHSDAVKKVGHGFASFGNAVTRAYHKIF